MNEREKYYIEKYKSERLLLKEACEIWRKPSYSKLSKQLPNIGYEYAMNNGIIPKYTIEGNAYLFHIKDILAFMDNKHGTK